MLIALPGLTLVNEEVEQFEMCMKTVEKGIREFMAGEPLSVKIHEIEHPDILFVGGLVYSTIWQDCFFAEMCREIWPFGQGHHDVSEYKFSSQFESQRKRIGICSGEE